jgi:hypothetical protein
VLGSALRTDRQAFRRLVVDDPLVIELREWSRMADELQQERVRLANRVRQQLWRYYPQAVELTDDVADDWFLALWQQVPTPAATAAVSEETITRILKDHRIRRLDAATVLQTLRKTPLFVAPGTTEAACAHIRAVAARLSLVNLQIKQAHRALDGLCAKLEAATENPSGQIHEQHDVTILRSWPGIGRIVLATLLTEATEPLRRRDYHALRALAGTAPGHQAQRQTMLRDPSPRLQQTAAKRRPSLVARRHSARYRRPAALRCIAAARSRPRARLADCR